MGHLIFGLIAIMAGLLGVFVWWDDFGQVLRGLIPITLIVVGLIGMGAGMVAKERDARERAVP